MERVFVTIDIMNLGELKASLNRFPGDFDNCEVIFGMLDKKDKEKFDTLAFTAYVNVKGYDDPIFLLGSHNLALKLMAEGRILGLDKEKPDQGGFNLNP